jgi:hypothetical protein
MRIYKDGVFMGTCTEAFGEVVFRQYSNEGVIYDKALAEEYLLGMGVSPDTLIHKSGYSTKTQTWFTITGRRKH